MEPSNAVRNQGRAPRGRGRGKFSATSKVSDQSFNEIKGQGFGSSSDFPSALHLPSAVPGLVATTASSISDSLKSLTLASTSTSKNVPSVVETRPGLPKRFIGRGRGVIPEQLRPSPGNIKDDLACNPICEPGNPEGELTPNLTAGFSPTSDFSDQLSSSSLESLKLLRKCNDSPSVPSSIPSRISPKSLSSQSPIQNVGSGPAGSDSSSGLISGSGSSPTLLKPPLIRKGNKGKEIKVTTNYLRLSVEKDKGYYEYHVDFEPNIPEFSLRKKIMHSHREFFGPARSFDGTILYLSTKLPNEITTLRSTHDLPLIVNSTEFKHNTNTKPRETARDVEVVTKITFIQRASMTSCVHFYNLLFRRFMHILSMVEMGRNYFDPKKSFMIPQHKLEIWPGMVTAVDEYEGGLMLTCDTSFRVLSTLTMLDLLKEIRKANPHPNSEHYKEIFLQAVLGKIVLTRYNNKSYRIDDVAWDQTPLNTFSKQGQNITFRSYFQAQYQIEIQDLDQPLLISRPKKDPNPRLGRFPSSQSSQVICLIPELCHNTGLSEEITSSFGTMKDISSYTRLSPHQRLTSLQTFIKNLKNNEEITKILQMWGLSFKDVGDGADGGINLNARIIQPPNIEVNSSLVLKQAPSDFSKEIMSHPVMNPVTIKSWAVLCLPQDLERAKRFVASYRQACVILGILVTSDAEIIPIKSVGGRNSRIVEDFRRVISQQFLEGQDHDQNPHPHTQFLVIILPGKRQELYGSLKQLTMSDLDLVTSSSSFSCRKALPTQMILSSTLTSEKKLRAIVTKIALQINCKLGGWLWSLQIPLKEKIMFIGMDVYHDPKSKRESCLALVASMNGQHTKFFSRIILQRARQETGDSLGSAFSQALTAFYTENNAFPDRIVVFRDGVGDGQIDLVREHEVVQFLSVMDFIIKTKGNGDEENGKANKTTKFTFVIIQKRVHTRIFSEDEENENGNMGRNGRKNLRKINPHPGTVLDHTVTRKYLFDFFLVSQYVRDGTVTPTHYVVLDDNCAISPDLIQKFAFVTTFMYFNWPGTIRVPAVCQYAHKLAYLVGEHLDGRVPAESLANSLYFL